MRRLGPGALADELAGVLAKIPAGGRHIVAIAGAPGSGKSTLVDALEARFAGSDPGAVAVLPMDGFHYDDEVLVPLGLRPRKGAPHTFDVGGLAAALARLRRNHEPAVAVPRFDRGLEIARAGALLIDRAARLILVEGNWLLLDEPPWDGLEPLFDTTVLLRVPEGELRRRLEGRWTGLGLDGAAVAAKLEDNDLPNGRRVLAGGRAADIEVVTG